MDTLLEKLESLVDSDDFEYDSEDIISEMEAEGAGFETVEALLGIMERHPLADFGMPGSMVHFIERFYPQFVPLLIDSVKRAPSLHTVWMLNRCINGASDKSELLSVLEGVINNENADNAVRDNAKEFFEYQSGSVN